MIRVFAYLDPGSGSMILQMLLGGFAALVVSLKMFGKKVFRTLAFWKKDEEPAEPATAVEATESEKKAVKETV